MQIFVSFVRREKIVDFERERTQLSKTSAYNTQKIGVAMVKRDAVDRLGFESVAQQKTSLLCALADLTRLNVFQ